MTKKSYSIDDLLYLMARLRDPVSGCPWDLKQSASNIINYSIEEVYELADAIETDDVAGTKDELGDVLFQVVFLSRLAEEQGDYQFDDVVSGLVSKLIRRHPHVFTGGVLRQDAENEAVTQTTSEAEVKSTWEEIKRKEREKKDRCGLFDGVPQSIPALNRAAKLQKRAATVGYDWPDEQGPLSKVREETEEVKELLAGRITGSTTNDASNDPKMQQALNTELGDLLFSTVNLCRKLDISPEQALRAANRKFERRISAACDHPEYKAALQIEQQEDRLLALDQIWQVVKVGDVRS